MTFRELIFCFNRGNFLDSLAILSKYWFKKMVYLILRILFIFFKKKEFPNNLNSISRVVIYFPSTSGLGDLIMANSFFEQTRNEFSNARIYIFCSSDLLINKKYYFEFFNIKSISLFSQLQMIDQIKPDLFMVPEKSIYGSILFLLNKAKFKLGYLSSYKVVANFNIPDIAFDVYQMHYFNKSVNLLKSISIFCGQEKTSYQSDLSFVDCEETRIPGKYFVLIPNVLWGNRTLSFAHIAKCAELILKKGFFLCLAGGQESVERNRELAKLYSDYSEQIHVFDQISLQKFVGIIKESSAIICGDSGPYHIANGFHKPIFSFWGPTNPELRKPNLMNQNSVTIFEKGKCNIDKCYNMEYRPLCDSCLRLENISDFETRFLLFLSNISAC